MRESRRAGTLASCTRAHRCSRPAALSSQPPRKPKAFTVEAKHRYVCPIPASGGGWRAGGTTSLTTELSTSYEVTFTPWKR